MSRRWLPDVLHSLPVSSKPSPTLLAPLNYGFLAKATSFLSLIFSLKSTAFIAHRSFQIGGKLLGFHHIWNSCDSTSSSAIAKSRCHGHNFYYVKNADDCIMNSYNNSKMVKILERMPFEKKINLLLIAGLEERKYREVIIFSNIYIIVIYKENYLMVLCKIQLKLKKSNFGFWFHVHKSTADNSKCI